MLLEVLRIHQIDRLGLKEREMCLQGWSALLGE